MFKKKKGQMKHLRSLIHYKRSTLDIMGIEEVEEFHAKS